MECRNTLCTARSEQRLWVPKPNGLCERDIQMTKIALVYTCSLRLAGKVRAVNDEDRCQIQGKY